MQSIEAAISLLVFISISAFMVPFLEEHRNADDSLYKVQLGEDSWRVLYLRGDFQDLNGSPESRMRLEGDMAEITSQTGLCVFMGGVEFTSCRGSMGASTGRPHEITVSLSRTAVYNGTLRSFTFALGN